MTMLLTRFYAIMASQHDHISLQSGDSTQLASVTVVRFESLLIGEPLSLPRHVRLGVGRLISVNL